MQASIVFYTNLLIPERFAACAYGPFILIRPNFRADRGLLEHERVHVRQWWRTLGLHGIPYLLSRSYRLRCEIEAYREQLRWTSADSAPVFARFVAEKYDLRVSADEALALLLS